MTPAEIDLLLDHWLPGHVASAEYMSYEQYFRGSQVAIEGRKLELESLARQLESMRGEGATRTWLDVGAGSGHLIEAVAKIGAVGYGIEQDAQLAASGIEHGLRIFCGDALPVVEFLRDQGARFDVVSASHLIEHLEWDQARQLVSGLCDLLAEGGDCILITPNAKDLRVIGGSFYRDPTHCRPYPIELLQFMLENEGLKVSFTSNFDRFIDDGDQRATLSSSRTRLSKLKERLSVVAPAKNDLVDSRLDRA